MSECPHEKTRPCYTVVAGYMGDICEACGEWVEAIREARERRAKEAEERELASPSVTLDNVRVEWVEWRDRDKV